MSGKTDITNRKILLKTYDRSIEMLRVAVERAKLGNRDKMEALRRLQRSYPSP